MIEQLKYEILFTANFLAPGEVMQKAFADMTLERMVAMACSDPSSSHTCLAVIALLLARELDTKTQV